MSLDVSVSNLAREIEASERFLESRLKSLDDQIGRMHGPFFKGNEPGDFDPESHEFEIVAQLAPAIVFDNPRVRITTKLPGSQAMVASALQAAVNRQIIDLDLRQPLLLATIDALMRWGVVMTTLESDGERGYMDAIQAVPKRPIVKRISPKRFGWDPQAIDRSECRFYWHKWVLDKDTLLKKADAEQGWNVDVIESLAPGAGTDKLNRPSGAGETWREEITGYEIWVPEHTLEGSPGPEQGFHGTLFTLGFGQGGGQDKGAFLREPRAYYGPPWGPYTLIGIYPVPDEMAPLSPTTAVKGIVDMLNAKVKARHEMELSYKNIGLVASKDASMAPVLKKAESGSIEVINVDDVSKSYGTLEVGGATDQIAASIVDERARLAKYAGASDAARGTVTGAGTATENAIASEAGEQRIGFVKSQVGVGARQVCRTLAWFDYYTDTIMFPIGMDDAMKMAAAGSQAALQVGQGEIQATPPELWYQGGEHKPGSGYTFNDLELEIEPYSMERTSEALEQARFLALLDFLTVRLPALIQQPYIAIEEVVRLAGDIMNVPNLSKIVDPQIAKLVQGIALQGLMAPPEAAPQGRVGSDVGAGGKAPTGRPTLPARPTMPAQPFQGTKPGGKKPGAGGPTKPKGPQKAVA
jgi:hypothetical protein